MHNGVGEQEPVPDAGAGDAPAAAAATAPSAQVDDVAARGADEQASEQQQQPEHPVSPGSTSSKKEDASASTAPPPPPAAAAPGIAAVDDELEPQLKYERLGCDVKTILQGTAATCLCLSEKVLALGTAAGGIHILDYSGNEVGAGRGLCRFAAGLSAPPHLPI